MYGILKYFVELVLGGGYYCSRYYSIITMEFEEFLLFYILILIQSLEWVYFIGGFYDVVVREVGKVSQLLVFLAFVIRVVYFMRKEFRCWVDIKNVKCLFFSLVQMNIQ